MLPSFLSFVALYESYLRRCFIKSGLSQQTIDVDGETTLQFWGPSPARSARRPALVFLHGFGPKAIWQWRRQAQHFAPEFDVYVPDLVFFGGSTTRSAERSEAFQAASVGKLLERAGVERYSVVGTSYGGFVAYHMARMWPDRVEKAVIASSGINRRRSHGAEMARRAEAESPADVMLPETAASMRRLLGLAVSRRVSGLVPDFVLNDVIRRLYSENRKEKIELLRGSTTGKDDTPHVSALQQDVLLVWGENDQIFPVEMATELKELLGKKVRLEVIEKTGHVPQLEDTARFNKIVESFLRGPP
ncbi:2-hydroxymuconate semialdehyde hydrolase-like isoform X1 [Rhodamnia argentea]|uniref:2-hydroxymuconate semialdehyde hydrolase-like isoform X1 n=1 Tax=Rhodamnia argentea TaxID=178133 RepID=A0A8B8PW57_9MYRT|nr:2-hydroxymuconate semialdehyde hydrolase-like isoform X1 [Rhodamnia argentea]